MVIPAVAVFFAFHTLPALQGVFYSFTNSRGYGDFDFVGVQNYIDLLQDPVVFGAYRFTLFFGVVATVAVNVISLSIALMLAANIRFRAFLRGIFFLPAILATLVVSYVFRFVFAYVLPDLGQTLGIEELSSNILGDPSKAWIGIVVVAVWQDAARTIVIYLAGLQTIPEDVIEASMLDGAGGWTRFWKVTFPLLAPFFTVNMLLTFKSFLQVFDQVVALTEGGPGTSTTSISYLIYRNAFHGGEFAYQSANAVIYFIVIAVLSFAQLRYLRSREVSA
ncbi:MAG: carbohydrate ABC transporter permease [Microbacterium gubbeenense]